MQVARAERRPGQPLDVVFIIDNSGSMAEEIAAIRRNINDGFAALIAASGADFRVIVVSQYGPSGTDVCIDPPLAGAACDAGLFATNGPRYFHYDAPVDSLNPLCKLLESFDAPDRSGRSPGGLRDYLRPEAHKALVLITDDSAQCRFDDGEVSLELGARGADPYEDALRFHRALLDKAPDQVGVPPDVRYQLFSFVGLRPSAQATAPYFPHEALVAERCDSAASAGLSYQALSVITDALRYPVCEGRGFDAVFRVLAQSVVESVKAACAFEIPTAPPEQMIDRSSISLRYRSSLGAREVIQLEQVEEPACHARAFYVQGDRLELCATACTRVQSDPAAEVEVLYGCLARVE